MGTLDILPILPSEVEDAFRLVSDVAQGELGMPKEALTNYRDLMEKAAQTRSESTLFLGSRHDGNITGVLLVARPEGGVATIIWLIVSPQFRGMGYGAALFERACVWTRAYGCHKIKLTASTQEATHFYERHGMEIEGYHRMHWWKMDFWSLGMRL